MKNLEFWIIIVILIPLLIAFGIAGLVRLFISNRGKGMFW